MRAPIPFNSDVCNVSKEVRIEHKLHIHNIVYKWNHAVQSCVWAKLYVGSEACMLAFDTHWEVIVGRTLYAITRPNINASHDTTLVVEHTVHQVEKRMSRIVKLLVRGFQRR